MKDGIPQIIVAHPGKQHSFRLASALKKAGMLECYCTTVYDKETSLSMRFAKLFARGNNIERVKKRRNPDLTDDEVIQFCEPLGLFTILCTRLDKTRHRRIYRKANGITSDIFGRKVARLAIKRHADAVVCYDSAACACWEKLQKQAPNIQRIMDSSHMARPAEKELIEKEITASGNDTLKQENIYLWNSKVLERLQKEIDLTQVFLCPSEFVISSLQKCGVRKEQCLKIPYGANLSSGRELKPTEGKVKFLFVGGVSYAKGVHYLLSEFSKLDPALADLTLVGSFNSDSELFKRYCSHANIHFTGWVLPDEVKNCYERSDVFVLYSPREGLAQVGLEAMACGLPVIVSDHTGVNDFVIDGENGFVIPFGDSDKLYERMKWFTDHKEEILSMGENARLATTSCSWNDYNEQLNKSILSIWETKGKSEK